MMKSAFGLVQIVVIMQMSIVMLTLLACFALRLNGHKFENERCDGSKSAELLSMIAAQSFALLAAETTRPKG